MSRDGIEDDDPPAIGAFAMIPLLVLGQLLVLGAREVEGRGLTLADLFPSLFWLASTLLLLLWLRLGKFRGSASLAFAVLFLSGLGVLVRARMRGTVDSTLDMALFVQPLGWVWLLLGWMLARRGRIAVWRPFWPLAGLLALGVVAAVIALGSRFRGAMFGPGGMTPTEVLKVLVPFALAGWFAATQASWHKRPLWNPPLGQLFLLALGWGLLCALLVLQRDLGLLVLLSLTLLLMILAATGRVSWGLGAILAGGGAAWFALPYFAHGARRIQAWLDPFADPTGAGWQVLQGLSGLYAGGLFGTGLGRGSHDRLPIAGSDFVYAVFGEEMGFIGCLLLLLLYGQIIRIGFRIASRQEEPFPRLLATGLTAAFAVQTLVNVAGVVTLVPITGITLPYISQGGSSHWVTSLQFGLLLGLSEAAPPKRKKKNSSKRARRKK